MTGIVVDILGWIGACMLLYAYARVSSGTWTGRSRPYQAFNIGGSLLFIINSGYHGAYPSVAVNIIWAAIALKVFSSIKPSSVAMLFLPFALGVMLSCSSAATDSAAQTTIDPNLPATWKKFTANSGVTATLEGTTVVVRSTAIPDHKSPYFGAGDSRYEAYNGSNTSFAINPNHIGTQSLVFRIPVAPVAAASVQATPMGPIGLALNGVPFFNQYAAGGSPLTGEINSFDQYNGHPQMSSMYHYHVEPTSLSARLGRDGLLGFLLDGFPVYGPMENGALVAESALDAQHGHTHVTVEYPGGIYHYHLTATAPYLNGSGFHGTPGTVSQ